MKKIIIALALIILITGCSKGDDQKNGQEMADYQCDIEQQDIDVTVESNGQSSTVSSGGVIEVKATDAVSFIVPNGTQGIYRELSAHPKYEQEEYIDLDLDLIIEFTPGESFTLDISEEPAGAVVRYIICADNPASERPAPCYPSCYYARLFIKIVE